MSDQKEGLTITEALRELDVLEGKNVGQAIFTHDARNVVKRIKFPQPTSVQEVLAAVKEKMASRDRECPTFYPDVIDYHDLCDILDRVDLVPHLPEYIQATMWLYDNGWYVDRVKENIPRCPVKHEPPSPSDIVEFAKIRGWKPAMRANVPIAPTSELATTNMDLLRARRACEWLNSCQGDEYEMACWECEPGDWILVLITPRGRGEEEHYTAYGIAQKAESYGWSDMDFPVAGASCTSMRLQYGRDYFIDCFRHPLDWHWTVENSVTMEEWDCGGRQNIKSLEKAVQNAIDFIKTLESKKDKRK